MKQSRIAPSFVQYIPERLAPGILYVSREYGTAPHLCCCGCGEEVVTPLNPTDWSLTVDRDGVTLYPSIGNWSFACRSHYWIRRSCVEWAGTMEQWEIDGIRASDHARKEAYFRSLNENTPKPGESRSGVSRHDMGQQPGWLDRLASWLKGWLA